MTQWIMALGVTLFVCCVAVWVFTRKGQKMKMGTHIKLPNGQKATVVYNSLVGVGVKYGIHYPKWEDFESTDGNTFKDGMPEGFLWEPDALLRNPKMTEKLGMPCVCDESEVEILRKG